jgi:hypothetical protein
MSSWGYTDNVAIAGTVSAYTQNVNVVGSSTFFVGNVNEGDYLTISGRKYQVANVTTNTALTLTNVAAANIAGATAYLQQGPKFLANIVQMGGGDTDRQNNVATIQNVYGVDLSEMQTKQAKSTTLTDAGAGYTAAARSNTVATIATTGASQPTINATATVFFSGTTVANVTITNPGTGYTAAAQANTTLVISTTGATQPTTNATATINYTSSTESSNAAHTGWNTYITYVDAHGQVREKNEVLVAMSKNFTAGTAGDASDDTIFPDS